ncbi:MAG: shikimate dehydrogenase [Thaumarchaeota archaeon]|nr:shikimate dehydrogenase [Nitrososphaerota archaeon]
MVDDYYLLGENVGASLSPAMMTAAFESTGVDARYRALSVPRGEFRDRFLELRPGTAGMNLTIPYKSDVLALLDSLDEVSARISAVNVVKNSGGIWHGYNTDVQGITAPLGERVGAARLERALLIGAGGAARAFCEAMSQMGCREITVTTRDPKKGHSFADEMARIFPAIRFEVIGIDRLLGSDAGLVFNATPLGGAGMPLPEAVKRVIYGEQIVFDAVYRPMKTELLKTAEARGCRVIHGYEMLLNQGTGAFEIWTGKKAPAQVMRQALLGALEAGS